MNFTLLFKHKVPPPIIAIACAVVMCWIASFTPTIHLPLPWKYAVIALLCGSGLLFDLSALYYFFKVKTTINPITPNQTSTLVTNGIYRISRNPMYVGLLFFLLAWAIFLQSVISIIAIAVYIFLINRLQIKYEEQALEQRFGNTFIQYKKNVKRWL